MNPYAAFLGDKNAREVLAKTPGRIRELVEVLTPDQLQHSPAPKKWSIGSVLCHLADCEVAFAYRFRQVRAQAHHIIQPFDQDAWAQPYPKMDWRVALDAFTALRRWNLALLDTMGPDDFEKQLTHPERGTMTFRTLVESLAGHDLNHLKELEQSAGRAARA